MNTLFEEPPQKISEAKERFTEIEKHFSQGMITNDEALQSIKQVKIEGRGDYWRARELTQKILHSFKDSR